MYGSIFIFLISSENNQNNIIINMIKYIILFILVLYIKVFFINYGMSI